jgi:hypothetical protein
MNRRSYNLLSYLNNNKKDEVKIGEVVIDISKNKEYKTDKFYLVKYINPLIRKENACFVANLKSQNKYSYAFKNSSIYNKLLNHRNCILSIPVNFVELFEIEKLLQKIPLDIIIHEIIDYLHP